MSKEPTHATNTESRDDQKGKRLEYLYETSPDFTVYPLLGSLVRALGKNWRVAIYPSEGDRIIFEGLQAKLKDPSLMQIEPSLGTRRASRRDATQTDLVLIDSSHHPRRIKRLRDMLLGKAHVMTAGEDSFHVDYDLISQFSHEALHSNGVIAITGNGKGKSTSAFGIAANAVARGEKAAVVQWFKEPKGPRGTWSINEHYFPDTLQDSSLLEFYPTGAGFYSSPRLDRMKGDQAYQLHRAKALEGIELAKKLIASGQYKVIVLDEFVDTVAEISGNIPESLLTMDEVRNLLSYVQKFPETQIVATGRRVTTGWEDLIKDSYTIQEMRHPWSRKGAFAVSGLDF